jgi:hypothetical protein
VPDSKPPTSKDATPRPFGPFVLERRIAIGGTAEVFYARPRQGQRPAPQLVIKRLLRNVATQSTTRRSVAKPSDIVRCDTTTWSRCFGAGMVGNEPYLAMEYVRWGRPASPAALLRSRRAGACPRSWPCTSRASWRWRCTPCTPLWMTTASGSTSRTGTCIAEQHLPVDDGEVKLGDFGVAHTAQRDGRGPG